ncbi:MAG TPA: cation-transporting P-type ATPase [Steroidobacter sp.]|uniref:cation-transporting P-type ATPase n=1 Tax=Steroidobacter sp. TaxID=1978227 RepID=UPI002EDADF47
MRHSEQGQATAWHSIEAAEVAQALGTDTHVGLSRQAAADRLQRFGPNRLPSQPRRPAWLRLLLQFHNVLIYVMLGAAGITLAIGHIIDTAVLLSAVIVNAIIGFIQEGKAETALDAIRQMLSLHATVIRDGERMEVLAENLVPGDVVSVASGDRIPADLRIVSAKNLRVDESLLTGESVTVAKSVSPVPAAAVLAERRSMLYSGSLVASGSALGIVVGTGTRTELGSIGAMIAAVVDISTPLVRQMEHFSRWLAAAILGMSAMTFVVGVVWRGHPMSDMFVMVVALAASAIPEGLPAIMTVTLALGVQRMARRQAIVRKLPAVETLGAVTVICSDKTGTLTKNEMTVQRAVTTPGVFEVSGVGYAPAGAVHLGEQVMRVDQDPVLFETARCAALCNDASLRLDQDAWTIAGDPTEGALLTFAVKAGLDFAAERSSMPRTDVIPFESEHRFMATVHHDHRGHAIIYVKGAPEVVMSKCSLQMDRAGPVPIDVDYWRRQSTDLAARGMRILALACKPLEEPLRELNFDDIEAGCTLLALVGMIDPPREEAIAAVAECHTAGVRVKMITGDHADTAKAIGAQLGIGRGKAALTGSEVEVLDDAALRAAVEGIDVYARASPEHKLRLVQALQANGAIVAMTGDGVNDAPALKRADIGVAMGRKGTDAAKEAADMVLADDNFATIGKAIREGRAVYDNIKKFILFMLPTNGGEALVVIAAILFELSLPMTPAQILWINMATSSTLGLALAFEAAERDVMLRPPRDPRESLLSGFFVWRIIMVSTLMMVGSLGLFLLEMQRGASLETARTMAVSAVVVSEMFYLLNSRFILASVLSREGLFGNPYVLAAIGLCALLQLAFVYSPPLQAVFNSTGLSLAECGRVLAAGLLVFVVAELEKVLQRWRRQGPRWQPAESYRASELRVESP